MAMRVQIVMILDSQAAVTNMQRLINQQKLNDYFGEIMDDLIDAIGLTHEQYVILVSLLEIQKINIIESCAQVCEEYGDEDVADLLREEIGSSVLH